MTFLKHSSFSWIMRRILLPHRTEVTPYTVLKFKICSVLHTERHSFVNKVKKKKYRDVKKQQQQKKTQKKYNIRLQREILHCLHTVSFQFIGSPIELQEVTYYSD